MRSNGYKLLGFAVWRGARWYLRRRMPAAKTLAAAGLVAVGGAAAVATVVRRNGG